jgi:predicted anti-sigma-YlaC factor YlaD
MKVRYSYQKLACLLAALALGAAAGGCSVRNYAASKAADTLAQSGGSFASDNDPELIRAAAPFGLKTMDSLLEEQPHHAALLTAASRGYTQFAYAYVQMDAEELEDQDIAQARAKFARARVLYVRARDYGLRSLEVAHPGVGDKLYKDAPAALAGTRREDVPALYWTAASWGALISVSKGDPKTIAEVPQMQALIDRALVLDEAFDAGAIHTFLISYEPLRQGIKGDGAARAQQHFQRAVELSGGTQAAPYVALAEAVALPRQDRAQFELLLEQALAVDVDARPQYRLANLIMQRRARWLLSRTDELIPQ